jgi:hypothetical protein
MLIDGQDLIIDDHRNSVAGQNLITVEEADVERWAKYDQPRPHELERSRKRLRRCTCELDRSTRNHQR